jgi:hypothetical protein
MRSRHCVHLLLIVVYMWMLPAGAGEQMEQETILIKGDQGLPRTLYIAPWKRVGAPLESDTLQAEIGEEPEPLERDLFQHELELYRQGYSVEQSPTPHTSPGPNAGSGMAR